jgi:chromosome segregation ATPase
MEGFWDLATKYGIGPAILAIIVSKVVTVIFRDRSVQAEASLTTATINARIDIIELLQQRMTQLEQEQRQLRNELEEERIARAEADELVDRLMRRVTALEAQIRALGHEPVQVP